MATRTHSTTAVNDGPYVPPQAPNLRVCYTFENGPAEQLIPGVGEEPAHTLVHAIKTPDGNNILPWLEEHGFDRELLEAHITKLHLGKAYA